MATSTKLVTKYLKSDGTSISQTLKNVKQTATAPQIKSYVNAVVANGEIFAKKPVSVKSAQMQVIETTDVDLS